MRSGIKLSWGDLDLREVKSPDELPEEFNISAALLDRHIVQGRGAQTALLGPAGRFTYEQLYHFTNQVANAFRALGLDREQRVFLLLRDSPEFVASFLAAQRIGAIPVPVNTAAHPSDYEHYLRLTEPRLLVGDSEFLPVLEPMLEASTIRCVLSVRGPGIPGAQLFEELVSKQSEELDPVATHRDDSCHWWFTSGSTGESKAAAHLHRDMVFCLEPYLRYGLQMTPQDITFSVSRMTFSYGLVNSLYLPLWVGAAALLLPERPDPSQVLQAVDQYQPTLLFSVPTFYARMLRDLGEAFDRRKLKSLRLCISAGEALPAPIFQEWLQKTGLQLADGVGSTEFGYCFMTHPPGKAKPGVSGKIVPGYKARLVDAEGNDVPDGELGELWLSNHSVAAFYWRNHAATKKTFVGEWLRTGDQYVRDSKGYYTYHGRTNDVFKSGGLWVSPIQVESVLLEHPAVAEASVVAERDAEGLEKPVAYLVLRAGAEAGPQLERHLHQFSRERLARHKCPKCIYFVSELPKTSSGKMQRFKLRLRDESEEKLSPNLPGG
jgi:benzoate-CoA ligase